MYGVNFSRFVLGYIIYSSLSMPSNIYSPSFITANAMPCYAHVGKNNFLPLSLCSFIICSVWPLNSVVVYSIFPNRYSLFYAMYR